MSGPNATVWSPRNPDEGEYTQGTANNLADSSGNTLVDATGVSLIDDGTTFTPLPQTTWSVNDTA